KRTQWMIDGELRGPGPRPPARSWGITVRQGAPELEEVAARLEHMDETGTDIQVMHNTLFGSSSMGTFRPEVELALFRSWNRWVGDATRASNGRLRWSALLPVQTMDAAVAELEWAVQHGACAGFFPPIGPFGILTDRRTAPLPGSPARPARSAASSSPNSASTPRMRTMRTWTPSCSTRAKTTWSRRRTTATPARQQSPTRCSSSTGGSSAARPSSA